MAKKILVDYNFNQNSLINAQVDNQASAPSAPVTGQIYYNTVNSRLEYYNGTIWVPVIDSTLTVGSASSDLLDITSNEITVKNLLITNTTVDAVSTTIAEFVTASYTVGNEFQEGDIIILPNSTSEQDRTWIHNGGTAVTSADFTRVSSTLDNGTIRAALSGGDGVTYNSGTGEIETTVDDSTIELSASDGSGALRIKADGVTDTHIDFGTGANQVNAADIPVIDSGGDFTATDVEGVLLEIFNTIPGTQDLSTTLGQGNTTGGNDLIITANDTINGGGSTNTINLNDGGGWSITSDDGGYTSGSYLYADATSAQLAVPSNAEITLGQTGSYFRQQSTNMVGDSAVYINLNDFGFYDDNGTQAAPIGLNSVSTGSSSIHSVADHALFLNSGLVATPSIFNIGIDNSVAVGGVGLTVKTSNAAYMNQISLQASGNAFDMILAPAANTADRTATFQDASGTVAYLSDISATSLSTGTVTATTYGITSDGGTDDVILVAATTSLAGLMTGADKTKLDGIEALADVTDSTNVAAAGAVMESDTSTSAMSFVIDEDNMVSDSATKVPTQQSVKAYADTKTTQQVFDITGNDSTTSFINNHALSNQWVSVSVINAITPFDDVTNGVDIEYTDANNVTVKFDVAPATGENYKVVITGL